MRRRVPRWGLIAGGVVLLLGLPLVVVLLTDEEDCAAADPTIPANLETLINTVKESGADMGVAFDGDGDRIGAVDSEGNILWGDQMIIALRISSENHLCVRCLWVDER